MDVNINIQQVGDGDDVDVIKPRILILSAHLQKVLFWVLINKELRKMSEQIMVLKDFVTHPSTKFPSGSPPPTCRHIQHVVRRDWFGKRNLKRMVREQQWRQLNRKRGS
jgi:hypothetical protein